MEGMATRKQTQESYQEKQEQMLGGVFNLRYHNRATWLEAGF